MLSLCAGNGLRQLVSAMGGVLAIAMGSCSNASVSVCPSVCEVENAKRISLKLDTEEIHFRVTFLRYT
jgi:hypothetical protein